MNIGVSALALAGRPEALSSGIARYCLELIDGLLDLESGHSFTVWVSPDFEAPPSWNGDRRCEVRAASGPLARYKTLWEAYAAGSEARGAGSDVWFSTAHALPHGWRGPAVLSVQDLFTFTHPEFYTWKHRRVIGWALRRALSRADGIVAISRHTRDQLVGRFGVDPERVTVTPLAVAQRGRAEAPPTPEDLRRIGVRGDRYLLTLSTIEPRKNLPRLFEALALLTRQERFSDLRLAVAGAPGWKTSSSFSGPSAHGVEEQVDLLGFVPDDDLAGLLSGCAAFVLPSIIEGFGLPLLEAMAAGAPVASSNSGSLPEVGGEAPVYFDPLDVHDMAAALTRALISDRTREERASVAAERAREFSWRRTAEGTLRRLEAAAEAR